MVKKYLFDLHHFDTPDSGPDTDANTPPAPPIFTQENLSAAQDEAFRRGKQEGFRESEGGISREIATFLGILNTQLDDLLRAEHHRADVFAQDCIKMTQLIYNQTCPALVQTESWKLTLAMIKDVIKSMPRDHDMVITLPELYRETLSEYLKTMYADNTTRFKIESDPLLPLGDCKIAWANGGAVQSFAAIQAQIAERLQLLLAETGATAHHDTTTPPMTDDKDIRDE